jgi:hypothetical protein
MAAVPILRLQFTHTPPSKALAWQNNAFPGPREKRELYTALATFE